MICPHWVDADAEPAMVTVRCASCGKELAAPADDREDGEIFCVDLLSENAKGPEMSRLGDEVARMRQAKGLTQKQLAKQAGVAEAYIQDVESGKRVMNDQLASRISKLLGGHFWLGSTGNG